MKIMPLNKSSGNMYDFISHTWNPVKGECPYHCSYCYVGRMIKRYGVEQKPLHLDKAELKTNLGTGNFIFVCSGCDLFHPDVPDDWIYAVLETALIYSDNRYLWHTKNPDRLLYFSDVIPVKDYMCATIESNISWPGISNAPPPSDRIDSFRKLNPKKMITIEPIMDFDVLPFSEMILSCEPNQVNIGADSGHNKLKEPSAEKLALLIDLLVTRTKVYLKSNLRRLLPQHRLYRKAV
jgi:protein gp37